jgi:hypothetical protein
MTMRLRPVPQRPGAAGGVGAEGGGMERAVTLLATPLSFFAQSPEWSAERFTAFSIVLRAKTYLGSREIGG